LRKYGVTLEEVLALLAKQDGKCAICGKPILARYHVDHDHGTGKVRGLLCFSCNGGLGSFSDNVDRLRSAIAYLEGNRE
jgi:hypothetical protein